MDMRGRGRQQQEDSIVISSDEEEGPSQYRSTTARRAEQLEVRRTLTLERRKGNRYEGSAQRCGGKRKVRTEEEDEPHRGRKEASRDARCLGYRMAGKGLVPSASTRTTKVAGGSRGEGARDAKRCRLVSERDLSNAVSRVCSRLPPSVSDREIQRQVALDLKFATEDLHPFRPRIRRLVGRFHRQRSQEILQDDREFVVDVEDEEEDQANPEITLWSDVDTSDEGSSYDSVIEDKRGTFGSELDEQDEGLLKELSEETEKEKEKEKELRNGGQGMESGEGKSSTCSRSYQTLLDDESFFRGCIEEVDPREGNDEMCDNGASERGTVWHRRRPKRTQQRSREDQRQPNERPQNRPIASTLHSSVESGTCAEKDAIDSETIGNERSTPSEATIEQAPTLQSSVSFSSLRLMSPSPSPLPSTLSVDRQSSSCTTIRSDRNNGDPVPTAEPEKRDVLRSNDAMEAVVIVVLKVPNGIGSRSGGVGGVQAEVATVIDQVMQNLGVGGGAKASITATQTLNGAGSLRTGELDVGGAQGYNVLVQAEIDPSMDKGRNTKRLENDEQPRRGDGNADEAKLSENPVPAQTTQEEIIVEESDDEERPNLRQSQNEKSSKRDTEGNEAEDHRELAEAGSTQHSSTAMRKVAQPIGRDEKSVGNGKSKQFRPNNRAPSKKVSKFGTLQFETVARAHASVASASDDRWVQRMRSRVDSTEEKEDAQRGRSEKRIARIRRIINECGLRAPRTSGDSEALILALQSFMDRHGISETMNKTQRRAYREAHLRKDAEEADGLPLNSIIDPHNRSKRRRKAVRYVYYSDDSDASNEVDDGSSQDKARPHPASLDIDSISDAEERYVRDGKGKDVVADRVRFRREDNRDGDSCKSVAPKRQSETLDADDEEFVPSGSELSLSDDSSQ